MNLKWPIPVSIFVFLLASSSSFGQTDWSSIPWTTVGDSATMVDKRVVVVTGNVSVKGSGASITGASISAETFKHFDYSDQNGRYALNIPTGNYRIIVRHVGMKPVYMRLRIFGSGLVNIEMEEGRVDLEELIIYSRPLDSNIKLSSAGLTTLNVAELKSLPTLMGEVDILKSLQLMPGVSSVGEGSSGINVRGGRTDQNLIVLNDVPLFNASHALGFVSAFNQDVIRDFTLYKGNVPANFGGRASSVLEINSRKGDFEKWHYSGGVGPLSARASFEGPILKSKTSLIFSARTSYADWILRKVQDPNVNTSAASFYDGFIGLSHRFGNSKSLDVSAYHSQDYFRFAREFGYRWNTTIVNTKFQLLADRKASPQFSLSFGRFDNTLFTPSGPSASELTNRMNYLQMKNTVNYVPNEKINAVLGMEAIGYFPEDEQRTGYNGNTAVVPKRADRNQGIELSLFGNSEIDLTENLSVSAGLRFSHYTHVGADTVFHYAPGAPKTVLNITDTTYHSSMEMIKSYFGLEPRISLRWSPIKDQSVKISYNRMRQYIHQISNSAAPTPVDIWQVSNQHIAPQIADNFSAGYFVNLNKNAWETSAEVFYKDLSNLIEYRDFPELYLNNHLETELLTGRGRAYGAELYIRRLKGKWTGWASYTYSQSEVQVKSENPLESINDGSWYPSNYNKPHSFNLVIDRKLMRKGAFSIIATYTSGRPLTAVRTSYIVDGTVVPIYSARNRYNIPDYFRIDVSITAGNLIRKLDDSLVFSIYNLFGRDNAYSVFYQRPATNFLIPRGYKLSVLGSALPSITYNFKF